MTPNAKINIGLYVTNKREDGFHDLETLFYPVSLCDNLEIHLIKGENGQCSFTQAGVLLDCTDEQNLVVKAYRLLHADYNLPAVGVKLTKHIPFGAGLGGGSSDAAFMLKGLNELCDLNLSDAQLESYASELGSDCAFFIRNKPVYACGRGDIFTEVSLSLKDWNVVLVKPDYGVSTADAFGGIVPKTANINLKDIAAIEPETWKDHIYNAFEETVFVKYDQLKQIKDKLYQLGATYASMSGSGSTVFGLFHSSTQNISQEFHNCFIWEGKLT